jgi:hypothetical protein
MMPCEEAMTDLKLLYILFQHPDGASANARVRATERAHQIADWPGLLRKTWIFDSTTQEYGGIYIFRDGESMQAYLDGPIVASMKALPGLKNFQTRIFDINAELSSITRGLPPL